MTTHARDLVQAVRAAGFTPKLGELAALLALLAETDPDGDPDELLRDLSRALTRLPAPAVLAAAAARLAAATPDPRRPAPLHLRLPRLLVAVAQHAPEASAQAVDILVHELERDPTRPPDRSRKAAAVALGKLGGDVAGAALLRYLGGALPIDHQRAVVAALGKSGHRAAIAAVTAIAAEDPELIRLREQALLILKRSTSRDLASTIRAEVRFPRPLTIHLHCREGLAPLLVEELAARGLGAARIVDEQPTLVAVESRGPLAGFLAARLWHTLAIALPPIVGDRAAPRAQTLAGIIAAPATRALLEALTAGALRYRIEWADGRHDRKLTWQLAAAIEAQGKGLLNDPTDTTWVVSIADRGRTIALELVPHRLLDERFAYRLGDIPAASHPTIAAGLARLGAPTRDDVVWDPFVGSGTELVECARLGDCRTLLGTDLAAQALAIARGNLSAAGVDARTELHLADALTADPRRLIGAAPTLVATNPPLGRRLRGDVGALLERFIGHAATVLAPGGRLVWASPVPTRTEAAGRAAGLVLERAFSVDLGGFDARFERWRRPA